MEFFYRNANPAYRGSQAQPTQSNGLLAGLGSVVGGGAPAYRSVTGASAQAPASARTWWRALAVTPSYKTAPPCGSVFSGSCTPAPDDGDDDADPAQGCPDQAMQVVIL